MTDTPKYYRGFEADGSVWLIAREDVIKDMLEHDDDPDHPWPDPIPEKMVADWLHDNADTMDSWYLWENPAPKRDCFLSIEPYVGNLQLLWRSADLAHRKSD